jgi:integrase
MASSRSPNYAETVVSGSKRQGRGVGGVELQQLNAAHLNRLYAELLQSGRVRTEGGLSPTSVRRIHAMLRKALKDAIRWGLAERNAAELADPPSTKVIQAARRRSMRTWSEEDLRRFLAHTREHELGPVWLFAASTGVRRSELLGVRWSDIDLRAVIVTIRQTVLNSEDGHRPEEDQKTVASARTIHLDRRTVAMLRAHRAAQAKTRLAAGAGWEDNDLVFTRLNGGWWNPDSVSSAFRRAVKAAGVPVIRLHDVRHTHASLLLKAGVNAKVVSERLGHSSVASPSTATPTCCPVCSPRPPRCSCAWCSARSTRTRPCAQPRRTSDGRS